MSYYLFSALLGVAMLIAPLGVICLVAEAYWRIHDFHQAGKARLARVHHLDEHRK
jgi:hypothetical protein